MTLTERPLLDGPADRVATPGPPVSARRRGGRRGRLDALSVVGGAVLALVVVALALAPWISPADPTAVDPPNRLAPTSWAHPLGTDLLGRDVLSRILHGGRTSVLMALAATVLISALGVVLGVLAGVRGGIVDSIVMRVVEVLQAAPFLIVALVLIKVLGTGVDKLVLVVALLGWPGYARVVRSAALSVREREFVSAARALGSTRRRLMTHHVVPNLLGPVIVMSTLDLGRILLTLSTLSFLGFGVQPPNPEWGSMLADARTSFYLAPRLLLYPGLAISIVALAVNLVGDGLRKSLHGRN